MLHLSNYLQIGIYIITFHFFPAVDFDSVHFHAFGSLNQRSAEGQRFALSGVELLEGFRKVAFQRGGGRVAVSLADFTPQQLFRSGHTQQPHRGFPLAGIVTFGNLGEGQHLSLIHI